VEPPRTPDAAAASAALEAVPELLGDGVEVGRVTVTFGTSYAATAQALEQGGVDLAFLPAADFIRCGSAAEPILAAAPQRGGTAGTLSQICTSPTEYGEKLAGRTAAPTWNELDHARWGVLERDSLAGYQCLELWLEDNYEGSGVEDLSNVAVYAGWEELLRAAAAGEIDLFPLPSELRETYGQLWTMDATRTDAAGARGFGRERSMEQELGVLDTTPRLYAWVAAVSPQSAELTREPFPAALADALEQALPDPAVRLSVMGAEHYAAIRPEDLDGMRRLMMGET